MDYSVMVSDKSIGIVTFHFSKNYGSALQSYALYKTLLLNGYKPKVIDYCPSYHTTCYNTYNPFKDFYESKGDRSCLYVLIKMIIKNIIGFFSFNKKIKNRRFTNFIADNLQLSERYKYVRDIEDSFDIYISGSDQIWNYRCVKDNEYGGAYDKAYFLAFAKSKKKIAYAVSAQHGEIRTDLDEDVLELLKDYDFIFTRENALTETLHSLGRTDALTVLDPTLLLEKEYYEHVETKNPLKDSKYILVYNLPGEYSSLLKTVAKKISKQMEYKIVDISPIPYFIFNSHTDRKCGPAEFLSYIHNAEYVLTDSFHAVIFSLIYKKNFNCVLRENSDERIKNILNLCDLTDRLVISSDDEVNTDAINYRIVDKRMNAEKKKSIDLLIKALEA